MLITITLESLLLENKCDESVNLIKSSRDTFLLNPQKNKPKPQKKGIFLIIFFQSSSLSSNTH